MTHGERTLSGIAEELERLDKLATPGPWEASEDAVGGDNDYKTLVQAPGRYGMFGIPIAYCHHDWETDRISWKQAEANAALISLIRSNLPMFIEAAALLSAAEAREGMLREAVMAVVEATRAYLPPDGIDARECISRILGATDNPTINPIIEEIENGRH